ncbi:LOW QUALITY PROTEIN: hypothetical protein TorRG33x02_347120 [Trema orientale]|uniref:Uncharacterized protein n=1 Tax=Trema orientale TaxID=63057 RepID=A0A2P5ALZ5_TREOI|nr:LOW QUALITY PROTEIN: hypothetical protein TorRG33x02_347120 [Trema orientale]
MKLNDMSSLKELKLAVFLSFRLYSMVAKSSDKQARKRGMKVLRLEARTERKKPLRAACLGSEGSRAQTRWPPVNEVEGMKVPSRTLRFSTLELSKRMGKLTASRTVTTLGSEAMNGPGGMLVRNTVEPCCLIRDRKNSSWPWL